jgi:hypothetical protein
MDQSVVERFRVLEQKLAKQYPQAVKEAEALGAGITDPRTANADVIWEHTWHKPLYANTKVAIGDNMIRKLMPYARNAWHDWGAERGSFCITKVGTGIRTDAFKAITPLAQQIRSDTGIAMYRLFAIQGAAGALRLRAARSGTPYSDLVNVDPGVMVPAVQREMGPGWGPITVLHFLTDLGLACKPDLNLVRTVRHLGLARDLKERKVPDLADSIEINRQVHSLAENLDGSFNPSRLRYVDKILMEISRYGLIGPPPTSPDLV